MSDLTTTKRILLTRCENGWLAHDSRHSAEFTERFVFDSTAQLAKALPRLLGESSWHLSEAPARDAKGHFTKKTP